MSEATKRSVCNLLGCVYDKCQWRNDGYNGGGGGYSGGGYSGGGYTDTIREYTVEVVKDERTEKYTEEEPTVEYKPVEEYKEEEEEKVVATPVYITNKVEPEPTKESYGSTCSDVSFFFQSISAVFAFISHIFLTIASFL